MLDLDAFLVGSAAEQPRGGAGASEATASVGDPPPEGVRPPVETGAVLPALAAKSTEAIILDFPEPAITFDLRGVCLCMNERAAVALRLNRRLAVGCGIATLRLSAAVEGALRALLRPAAGSPVREIRCSHGGVERLFVGTTRPGSGHVLVTWTDLSSAGLRIEIG